MILQRPALLLLMVFSLVGSAFSQQYRIHTWESFESGVLPENIHLGHYSDSETVGVVDIFENQNVPSQARGGVAPLELGTHSLLWKPMPDKNHLSIFAPDGLNRERIGQNGAALYQADFYLPAVGEPVPNISMLAQVLDSDGSTTYKFYRFGILEPGDKLFFAFTNDAAQPEIFQQVPISQMDLQRPGWHRFQIIFHGQNEIYCAVDGEFTSFSPVLEGTHTSLNAGIMVTSSEFDSVALTDNLSIQWTPQNAPLPESPWTQGSADASRPNTSPLESGSSVSWLQESSKAWSTARRQQRPILAMFYTPNITPYERLKQMVPNTPEAYEVFNRFVLLKIDANQLAGGRLAEKFEIFRLPTFVVIGSDGLTRGKITVSGEMDWNQLRNELQSMTRGGGGGGE